MYALAKSKLINILIIYSPKLFVTPKKWICSFGMQILGVTLYQYICSFRMGADQSKTTGKHYIHIESNYM